MLNRIKVLYLSYDGILDSIGQSQIIPYIKKFSEKGIKYTLLSFEKKNLISDKKYVEKVDNELKNYDILWKKLKYHKRPSLIATVFDIIQGCLVSIWIIRKNKIKIVHSRSYVVSLIALILKKVCGIKFIFDMRGFWVDERIEGGLWFSKGILYKASKFLEKRYLNTSDRIISLTNVAKKEIERNYLIKNPNKIDVIPTCVDLELFDNKINENLNKDFARKFKDKFVFTYLGSLGTWYMLDEMIDFFKYALELIPNAHFLILTSRLREASKIRDEIEGKEKFTILKVAYEDVPSFLAITKVGLAFYSSGYSRLACSPVKLSEYLASSVPVIINSGVGDSEELVNKERIGYVLNEFSGEEYRKAIQYIMDLKKEKESLEKRCRNAAENYFDLDKGVKSYMAIYKILGSDNLNTLKN